MKIILSCCMALFLALPFGYSQNSLAPIGDWKGTLNVNGISLPIIFHIKAHGDGLKATMDSPDQGAFGVPCTAAHYAAPELTVELAALQIRYQAKLEEGRLVGVFHQGAAKLPLTLERLADGAAVPRQRPQQPKAPFEYHIQEVTFPNNSANIQLAGTLTLPKDCNQCPAAILISGSGPQDRNETILGHQPFWVIADYLTRQGIAVLRFDDRGVADSEGAFKGATSADFMTDAAAALAYLQQQTNINPNNIGLIGHSEGGLIAPMLAAQNKDVAFIISLAGPGMQGKDLLPEQARLIALANGASKEEAQTHYNDSKKACDLIAKTKNHDQLKKALKKLLQEEETPEAQVDAAMEQYTSNWFQFFMRYDPTKDWKKVSCPVLALNGAKDVQVPADDNLQGIAQALKAGNNPQVTTKKLEGLNHLFQQSNTGSPQEYATIEETFNEEVLALMATWIKDL